MTDEFFTTTWKRNIASYQNRKPKKSILERREAMENLRKSFAPKIKRVIVGRWCKGRWIATIEYRT